MPYVEVDLSGKWDNILNNLLSNAYKYTQVGGNIRIEVFEMEQTSPAYAKLCLKVIDDGIGMSQEFLAKIYESFTREESSLTNRTRHVDRQESCGSHGRKH